MLLKTVSKIFGLLVYICLSSACVADEVSDMCIKNLPNRLGLEKNAPETMRFVGDETDIIDYESQKGGQGWGYARKYRNGSCEVIVYVYNREKESISNDDVSAELAYFDGFTPEGQFQKDVGDDVFSGIAGIKAVDETVGKQVHMVSITAKHGQFIKYRTSCRLMSDLKEEANFRLADMFTTQVIKGTYGLLSDCLSEK